MLFQKNGQHQLITSDLNYLVEHWKSPSFDIWEDDKGDHFYTRCMQAKALAKGAKLAHRLGDEVAARRYNESAKAIKNSLAAYWEPHQGILRCTLNHVDGNPRKSSGLDSAVILAAIHSYGSGSAISMLDEKLLSTALRLEETFHREYAINHPVRPNNAVAIGRFSEDHYTGIGFQENGGNPWVVTTNGFAEYYYRIAAELGIKNRLVISEKNRPFFLAALGEPHNSPRLPVGKVLLRDDPQLLALRQALTVKGDAFLRIVEDHLGQRGEQREQFDRNQGFMVGAEELTWNHASFLSALRARETLGLRPRAPRNAVQDQPLGQKAPRPASVRDAKELAPVWRAVELMVHGKNNYPFALRYHVTSKVTPIHFDFGAYWGEFMNFLQTGKSSLTPMEAVRMARGLGVSLVPGVVQNATQMIGDRVEIALERNNEKRVASGIVVATQKSGEVTIMAVDPFSKLIVGISNNQALNTHIPGTPRLTKIQTLASALDDGKREGLLRTAKK
jgi:hypothetical protein